MVPPLRALLALPLLAAGSVAASARSRHASWDDARAPPSDEHYDPFLGMEQRRGLDGRPGTSMSMSMSMPRDREEEEGPGSPGGPGLSAAAVAVAVAGGDAEDCACAAPEGGEPPSSGDSCPILLLLPFTARGRPLRELPPGLGFSHMAAALLAIDHFNARDPSVVPDLPDLVPDCDVELPIRLPNGRSIAADVGDHVDPAVRAVLDSLGGDGTQVRTLCSDFFFLRPQAGTHAHAHTLAHACPHPLGRRRGGRVRGRGALPQQGRRGVRDHHGRPPDPPH